jgi:hypothetical protein
MPTRTTMWRAAIACMGTLAAAWISYQAYRYFADPGVLANRQVQMGAIDLDMRYREVQAWFGGVAVYRTFGTAVYPPATYAILGMFLYALPWNVAKTLWLAGSLVSAGWLGTLLARNCRPACREERAFMWVMPFALYPTGAAMGNGQVIVFVLPLALAAVLMLVKKSLTRVELWTGSFLVMLALVQPTIAAPFFWIVLICSPRRRAAVIVIAGYVALTGAALMFQLDAMAATGRIGSPAGLMQTWTRKAHGGAVHGSRDGGYGTVHNLLAELDLSRFNWPVSILMMVLLGAWILRYRRNDIWLLLGVTAIVARVWTYHRWYNDLLLIVPLITLFRLAREPTLSKSARAASVVVFVWVWAFLLAPGVLYTVPVPQVKVLVNVQVTGWIVALVLLMAVTETDHRARRKTTS